MDVKVVVISPDKGAVTQILHCRNGVMPVFRSIVGGDCIYVNSAIAPFRYVVNPDYAYQDNYTMEEGDFLHLSGTVIVVGLSSYGLTEDHLDLFYELMEEELIHVFDDAL